MEIWPKKSYDRISPPIKFFIMSDGYVWIQLDDMRKTKDAHGRTCKLWQLDWNKGRWGDHLKHNRGIFVGYTVRRDKNRPNYKFITMIAYYDKFRQWHSRKEVDIMMIERSGSKAID